VTRLDTRGGKTKPSGRALPSNDEGEKREGKKRKRQ
jgi:hypothetical protein